ncbi:hypothetical protein PCASD_26138 [Puccinia coronata f. sp. avenae]|uniref:Uncharacterized protein n=1 Tax=Puccinia coronata f. sp. avenae TaxID=200324 RepID=A0A2N5TLA7_9BASI|nr:hypothetical protein PCASD_26138 [Puccinia coronata f. sp. avenae]
MGMIQPEWWQPDKELIRDRAEVQSLNGKLQVVLNGNHSIDINNHNNIFEMADITTMRTTALISQTNENTL